MNTPRNIVVIGGGVIGCAVAYNIAKRGMRVTLLDQPRRGRATSASAGGLWPLGESIGLGCGVIFHKAQLTGGAAAADSDPAQLPQSFLDFAVASRDLFFDLFAELEDAGGIDIELEQTSLLFLMYNKADVAFATPLWQNCPCGRSLTERLTPDELARQEPAVTREVLGGLRFTGDDQLNPYQLADSLRAAARAHGAEIKPHVAATGLEVEGGRVTAVNTSAGKIACGGVVNAAGAWAREIGGMANLDIPVHPVRGQIIATETLPEILSACLSTTDCYVLQKKHGEIIIGSTTEDVDFSVDVTPTAIRNLAAGAVRALPFLENARFKRAWSGLRPGTPDELPILGPVDGLAGYYNACGHFRTGILTAPLTGRMIAEAIVGNDLSYPIEPFLLSRFGSGYHAAGVSARSPAAN